MLATPNTHYGQNIEDCFIGAIGDVDKYISQLNQFNVPSVIVIPVLSSSPITLQIINKDMQELLHKIHNSPENSLFPVTQEADDSEEPEDGPNEALADLYNAGLNDKASAYIKGNHEGIDVNYDEGLFPLRAVEAEDTETLRLILDKKPTAEYLFDAFKAAASSGHKECTEMLINYLKNGGTQLLHKIKTTTSYYAHKDTRALIDQALENIQATS